MVCVLFVIFVFQNIKKNSFLLSIIVFKDRWLTDPIF